MSLNEKDVDQAIARYEREYDRYVKLADLVYARCQALLLKTSVRATVQRRAKSPASLRKKLLTFIKDPAKKDLYNSVDDFFEKLSDLAGVRIATYLESDRQRIVEEIKQEFSGPKDHSPDIDIKDGKSKSPYYLATHCQVRIADEDLPDTAWNLRGTTCEIQVCSLLAHVWNEIEHDLIYKPQSGEIASIETDLLKQLAPFR